MEVEKSNIIAIPILLVVKFKVVVVIVTVAYYLNKINNEDTL